MSHILLRCTRCDAPHAPSAKALACARCRAPLDVAYTSPAALKARGLPGLWSLRAPSPVHSASAIVSLGEGHTPVALLKSTGRKLGLPRLYAKLEFQAPTGSFKDRGSTALLSVLKEMSVAQVVEDSSGNAGASIAAYAARAGVEAHIFAPASAPAAKLSQIRVYGARTHLIEGPRDAATEAAKAFAAEHGLVYASHNLSPFFLEGAKTFAYEVARQFRNRLPQHIVIPVGNGSLLIGAWKGFRELREASAIASLPKLHAVQAAAVPPIATAWRGIAWPPSQVRPTIAGGIAVGQPPRLEQTLVAIRDTQGTAVAVPEAAIRRWQVDIARDEGVYMEPTSAAAFAGLEDLLRQGVIQGDESVLVPVTGSGLKDVPPE